MLQLEEAQRRILDAINVLPTESVPLHQAAGRILAKEINSPIDLPGFDNSAVDGYAVRAEELTSARGDSPVTLRLLGTTAAGQTFSGRLQNGTCLRIFTGSPLPDGADAVAMQEDTKRDLVSPENIQFLDAVKPWENIRFRGEDAKKGDVLVDAGTRLGAGQLGLLAATGIQSATLGRRPMVGLLATGSELQELGHSLQPGQIYESNRITLTALAKYIGADVKVFPLVADTLAETKLALRLAFDQCDAVVTTGGVSVGEFDFVKAAFQQLGGNLDFWKISLKPGKPFVFGRLGHKFLFGLPGNPVSAFVTWILLVSPAVAKMQGAQNLGWPSHPGNLLERLVNRGDRRHFVRVTVDTKGDIRLSGTQASHILTGLGKANGLVEVPPQSVIEQGTIVPVFRWNF